MSASSIATEASFARVPDPNALLVMNNPTPSMGSLPSVAAAGSNVMPLFTPPQTPGQQQQPSNGSMGGPASTLAAAGVKRPGDASGAALGEEGRERKRRIAPTPVVSEAPSNP